MKHSTASKSHWDEHAAAEYLGVTVATMRDWRFRRVGPQYVKYLNKAVRYPAAEVVKFAEQSRVRMAA